MSTILLIDDNKGTREAMRRAIERAGHRVATAAEGDQGIRLDRELAPDLVVVDMLMPGKEGAATIIEIREARPEARILAISGGGSFVATEILRLAELVGADAAIQKPFSTAELLAAIDRCLVTESAAAPTTPP